MSKAGSAGILACMSRRRGSDDSDGRTSVPTSHVAEAATLQAGMPALAAITGPVP